jgi:UDP-N-acetylenolpyruvoylglucosamine reductase
MDERGIKDLFARELKGVDVRFDEPMKSHTSLQIGGPADVFVSPGDQETLSSVLELCRRSGLTSLPLGGGTNLLVRDKGLEGVVLSMTALRGIEALGEEGGSTILRVGRRHAPTGTGGLFEKGGTKGA